MKKSMTLQRLLGPFIYLVLAFLASSLLELPLLGLFITALIVSILWFFFYPAYFYRLVKKNATKMIREGKNESVLGEHTMIFTEDGLREISPKGEMTVSWSGIEDYGEDDSNFYLYNSGMSALILPKPKSGNSEAIRTFLTSKIKR